VDLILDQGVIPPGRHRKHQHRYDKTIYKERNIIERFLYLTKADITDANSSKVKRPPSEAARNERSVLNVSPLCGGA
jgi:hypothetical protein